MVPANCADLGLSRVHGICLGMGRKGLQKSYLSHMQQKEKKNTLPDFTRINNRLKNVDVWAWYGVLPGPGHMPT